MIPAPRVQWCAARLTNHGRLVDELGLRADASDDDVVAAAVARWGRDAPHHLLGGFAYAVQQPDGSVDLARDALGVMPAFWVRSPGASDSTGVRVTVSDSLTVLAEIPGVDTSPDEEYLAATASSMHGLRADRTAMIGVRRVPPGTTVRVTTDGEVAERWWRPESVTRERRVDIDTATDELRRLLITVMSDHLAMVHRRSGDQTSAGVAAHCSGGLDSTFVACLASSMLAERGTRLRALLSWSPDRSFDPLVDAQTEVSFDERDVLEGLAAQLGAPVHFVTPSGDEAPWLAASSTATFPRATTARESWFAPMYPEESITHVLSGWGGDEYASFNGRAANRAAVRRLDRSALAAGYADRRRRGQGRVRAVVATLRPAFPQRRPAPRPTRIERQAPWRESHPEIMRQADKHSRALHSATTPREVQLLLTENGHVSRRIDAWHQIGLRWGVEYGYPLLDKRIVEWALSMPPATFRIGEHSRRVFRRAVEGIVPDEICMSEKQDPVLMAALRSRR